MPQVDWQPWHTAAFLDAQRRRRPVLLLLETAWAPACAHAHAHVFARADVQRAIADTVVPIRVDADRRPDIGDRYGLGHWPSLLFLTPDGHVLTGGTHLDETLATRIVEVGRAFAVAAAHRPAPAESVCEGAAADAFAPDELGDEAWRARLAAVVWQARDPTTGVFVQHHVPCAPAALFAIAEATITGDVAWAAAATATLDIVAASVEHDGDARDARGPAAMAWSTTRLEDHAEWTRAFACAVRVDPDPRWSACLSVLVARLRRSFRRADGHWRPWCGAPSLVLVDASARASRALLAAADALADPALAGEAIEALEVLAPQAYARGAGVAHVVERGQPRGPMLLDDAMLLAHALLDAHPWRDDGVYRDLAEELLRTTTVRLQDETGALRDRVAALAGAGLTGRLAEPVHPLAGNALAATLWRRLFPDEADAVAEARRLLRAIGAAAVGAGVFAAPVALAWHGLGPAGDVMAAW